VRLLLFDIDGTLVLTGGAGVRAMNRAFETVFGVRDGFRGVKMAGGTDPRLLDEALERARLAPSDGQVRAFEQAYVAMLGQEMLQGVPPDVETLPARHPGRWRGPLPGVPALVDALAACDDVFLALLTGNYSAGAQIKLSHYGLWPYFRCGAYGEDAALRHELVPVALARARAAGCPPVAASDVVIVGDTVRDVQCARDGGVRCVAVATGGDKIGALREAGAEAVFDTLEDTPVVLRALLATVA
jgi:phosphoglycolate phosphatase-like HAD superfamily hydrolase